MVITVPVLAMGFLLGMCFTALLFLVVMYFGKKVLEKRMKEIENAIISHERVTVYYRCPECFAVHEFPLEKCPGDTCFVCDECDAPDDRDDYENFPEVVGISIEEESDEHSIDRTA